MSTTEATNVNPNLRSLAEAGTSPWLDFLSRSLVQDGELARLIAEDSLKGVTSNPSIFEKAMLDPDSDDYDEQLESLAGEGLDAQAIYEALAIADVQHACDVLRDLYESSNHQDGFVSLEVAADMAHDEQRSIEAARDLLAARQAPERDDQDPRHARGRGRDRAGDLRGHQRQRHAPVRRRGLRQGPRRLSEGSGAPPGGGQVAGCRLGGQLLRLPRRHGRRQAPGGRRATRSCTARRRSPTRAWPTATSRTSWPARGGRASTRRRPSRSVRCGPRRASRTSAIRTRCTSMSWSAPHTVNTMPPATLEAVADHGHITGPTAQRDPVR